MTGISGPTRLLALLLIAMIALVIFFGGLAVQRWLAFQTVASAISGPNVFPTGLPVSAFPTTPPIGTIVFQPWVSPWDEPTATEVPSGGVYILPYH